MLLRPRPNDYQDRWAEYQDGVTNGRVSKWNATNTGSIISTINIDTQLELKYAKPSHFPFIKQQSNAIWCNKAHSINERQHNDVKALIYLQFGTIHLMD